MSRAIITSLRYHITPRHHPHKLYRSPAPTPTPPHLRRLQWVTNFGLFECGSDADVCKLFMASAQDSNSDLLARNTRT